MGTLKKIRSYESEWREIEKSMEANEDLASKLTEIDNLLGETIAYANNVDGVNQISFEAKKNEIESTRDDVRILQELASNIHEKLVETIEEPFYQAEQEFFNELGLIDVSRYRTRDTIGYYNNHNANAHPDMQMTQIGFQELFMNSGVDFGLREQYETMKEELDGINYAEFILHNALTNSEYSFRYDNGIWDEVSLGVDLVPIVGDIKQIAEGIIGYDIFTREKLSGAEQSAQLFGGTIGLLVSWTGLKPLISGGPIGLGTVAKWGIIEMSENVLAYGATTTIVKTGEHLGIEVHPIVAALMYQGGRLLIRKGVAKIEHDWETTKLEYGLVHEEIYKGFEYRLDPEGILARYEVIKNTNKVLVTEKYIEELMANGDFNPREPYVKTEFLGEGARAKITVFDPGPPPIAFEKITTIQNYRAAGGTLTKTVNGSEIAIKYSDNGFPDFSEHVINGHDYSLKDLDISADEFLNMSFKKQQEWLNKNYKISFDDLEMTTWHHCAETGHFQLVDKSVHKKFKHTGGDTIWGEANK